MAARQGAGHGRIRLGAPAVTGTFLVILLLLGPGAVAAQDSEARSVLDGVYSEAQAERGQRAFNTHCGECHITEEFSGESFQNMVGGDPVAQFYNFVRSSMPYENPASLSRRAYLDVMAYILYLNDYPAGDEDLPATVDALSEIYFPEVGDDH